MIPWAAVASGYARNRRRAVDQTYTRERTRVVTVSSARPVVLSPASCDRSLVAVSLSHSTKMVDSRQRSTGQLPVNLSENETREIQNILRQEVRTMTTWTKHLKFSCVLSFQKHVQADHTPSAAVVPRGPCFRGVNWFAPPTKDPEEKGASQKKQRGCTAVASLHCNRATYHRSYAP